MNILLLGPDHPSIVEAMKVSGDSVINTEEPLTPDSPVLDDIDFIVSYGYRHILRSSVLGRFFNRCVNLHISYLPWNRGADPNLWSFLEDTPKGVTIHYIDSGVDTGDILAQREVNFSSSDTLATSYRKLCEEIEHLFAELWPDIRTGRLEARPQSPSGGTYHRLKDKQPFLDLLTDGWDTPVERLVGCALQFKTD